MKANQGAAHGSMLISRTYTYDAAGNITQRQTEDGVYAYGYLLMDRIIQVMPPASVQNTLPVEAYAYALHKQIAMMEESVIVQMTPT